MNKLATMVANGEITVEELANIEKLIERAKLVKNGVEACKKTITFPLGKSRINCYSYMDSAGEYEAWGSVSIDGTFICDTNWGGTHEIGRCNINDFKDVFMAFENGEFAADLARFLNQQIEKANSESK